MYIFLALIRWMKPELFDSTYAMSYIYYKLEPEQIGEPFFSMLQNYINIMFENILRCILAWLTKFIEMTQFLDLDNPFQVEPSNPLRPRLDKKKKKEKKAITSLDMVWIITDQFINTLPNHKVSNKNLIRHSSILFSLN